MKEWMRKIPHPHYGRWCGAKNTHDEWDAAEPVDNGDAACRIHDFALRYSVDNDDLIKAADYNLLDAWSKFNPTTFWGNIYRCWFLKFFRRS